MLELSILGLVGIAMIVVALVADWLHPEPNSWTWRSRR